MWFRAFAISLLKWFAQVLVGVVLLRFVLTSFGGWLLAIPMWLFAFAVAFFFANWALSPRALTSRELGIFIGIWMVTTITLQLFYALLILGDIRYALNSPELYVQYLLEILAIFLASSHTQKKRMKSVLGEGMSA